MVLTSLDGIIACDGCMNMEFNINSKKPLDASISKFYEKCYGTDTAEEPLAETAETTIDV